MGDIKEFTPSTGPNPRTKYTEQKEITPNEEFQQRSAAKETERRNQNPLEISEIFELIRDGKITKERLLDFELDKELGTALGWVIDLLEKLGKIEKVSSDQKAAIEQFEATVREKENIIERLKKVIADLEEKFPPLGGA